MRTFVALSLLVAMSFQARAYDEDTHFYGTYAMARYAGIKHEVATKIALSAQWMDESFISDPMSLMFLGLSGVKKRRMLHFPADRFVGKFNAKAQQYTFGVTFKDVPTPVRIIALKLMKDLKFDSKKLLKMNFLSEVEKDHFLATQLLRLGLENGDLMQAAASLHVLEDSYAHAGTPAGEGHRGAWHWPDRPFHNTDKYFQMTNSVFQALAAIRSLLPNSAMDCSLITTQSGKPNCLTGAKELQEAYSTNADVVRTVSLDVLKDPEYVRETMKTVLTLAADSEIGYINMNAAQIEAFIESAGIDGGKNAYETLTGMVTKMTENHLKTGDASLNVYAAIADIYQIDNPTNEDIRRFIRNFGVEDDRDSDGKGGGLLVRTDSDAFKKFAAHMSKKLLRWYVPRKLNNDDHLEESELDSDLKLADGRTVKAPRSIEMEIRVRNMQELVEKLFGKKIEMIPNNSKDDTGFAHEIWMREDAKPRPVAHPRPGVEYVTFSLEEKNRWDHMIFYYLHPSLTDDDLRSMVDVGAAVKQITAKAAEMFGEMDDEESVDADIDGADASWTRSSLRVVGAAMAEWGEVKKVIAAVMPFAKNWLTDLLDEPKTIDNYSYHSVSFLTDLHVKPLLTGNDTWNEQMAFNNHRQSNQQTSAAGSASKWE